MSALLASSIPALLAHVWSSTIFLAIALLAAILLRKRLTAGSRFAVVLAGVAKFAVPAPLVAAPVRALWGALFTGSAPEALQLPLRVLGGDLPVPAAREALSAGTLIALAVWFAVAVALAARLAITRHRLVAHALRTVLPPSAREAEALERARRRLGIRRSIDLARTPAPEAPAVLRTLRPIVVLPLRGCDALADDELESILCHECAHVARQDNLVGRLESLVCAIFWFHPLLWVARKMAAADRERACDELVSASSQEQGTYLAALSKFCDASVAPLLPGVSCMATAQLKERMEHVMNYGTLKARALPAKLVGWVAAVSLVGFTLAAGALATGRAVAAATAQERYSVKVTAQRSGSTLVLHATVSENSTQKVLAAPVISFDGGGIATATSSVDGTDVTVEARPGDGGAISLHVTIAENGSPVQVNDLTVQPGEAESEAKYSGEPISLNLKDAELQDVLQIFGKITSQQVDVDPSIQGKVSVVWHNVPWDQAFESLLKENGLKYRIEDKVIHVTKK